VAAVAIALTAMVALSIYTQTTIGIGWIGITPILIAVLYVASIAWFRRMPLLARPGLETPKVEVQKPTGWSAEAAERSTRSLWLRFAGSAFVILISAPVVTLSVKVIADSTGIAQTFLGAALLAVTTSLPELIASIASVRIGAYDLAVGNLFGSNVANMSVLLFADIAYTEGPILAAVSQSQIVSGLGAILLMAIAVAAIVGESERTRFRRLEPDAIVLLAIYATAMTAIAYYGQ
jgi:cation:H+ antiporter